MSTEYKKLIQNFRLSIRRKQIDEMFNIQRHELLKQQNQKNKQALQYQLRDYQSRQNWIRQIALKLSGFPNISWEGVMKQLYYALRFYDNQFELWVRQGIANSICNLFKKQYLQLGLYKIAADIVTDILYLNLRSQNPRVIKSLLELRFVDDVLSYLLVQPCVQYIRLMAITCQVAPNLRNQFIKEGLLDFIVYSMSKKQRVSLKSSQLSTLLTLINSLLKTHQLDYRTFIKPKKTTILNLLPILSTQIQQNHPASNILIILQSIKQICLTRNQQAFDQLLQFPNIFKKSLEMICYQSRVDIRLKSVNFVSNFLLSENPDHTRYLAQLRILDRLHESYYLPGNRDENKLAILSLLSNFTADFEQFQQMVLFHPMMRQIIVSQASNSYRQQLRREAVYCISNIARKITDTNHQQIQLINQLKIPEILFENIRRSDRDGESVIEILNLWREIIKNNSKESFMHEMMISRLGVTEMLEDIVSSEDLEDNIGDFLNFYSEF